MTKVEALITAARRYCREYHDYWADRYTNERTGNDFPYTYTENDYNLFPRYNILSGILKEVETIVGQGFLTLEDCRQVLMQIGHTVCRAAAIEERSGIVLNAYAEETQKFVDYIENITEDALGLMDPLPYRRKMSREESDKIRELLFEKWKYAGSYWDPLVDCSPLPTIFLMKSNVTADDYQQITTFIKGCSLNTLFEITEDGSDAEIELSLFHPDCYETIYCDSNFEWVIYGSHESTITFGGSLLLEFVRQLFGDRTDKLNKWQQDW